MSSIVPSRGSGTVATGSSSSASKPLDANSWDEDVLSLEASGLTIPRLDGAPFAEMFAPDKGVRRRGETLTRHRTGWRAFRTGIVVVGQTQSLTTRPDGRLAPTGPWTSRVTTHLASVEPRRRTGDVPADDTPGADQNAGESGAHTEALEQIAYLPSIVRSGFLSVIAAPEVFAAEAQQMVSSDGRTSYSVRALRLIDAAAVVLLATRDGGSRRWRVEQVVYSFDTGRKQVGA